jgi:hypothetical protein
VKRPDDEMAAAAARNNADWCDLFSRLHGGSGVFEADAWASATRTPDLYPDAVTLRPSVDPERLLSRIEGSAGSSVKDSFGDLDLTPWGFERLFDASWISWTGRATATTIESRWAPVGNGAALQGWERAWGRPRGASRFFLPGLLERDDVVVLAVTEDGAVRAGAILSLGGGVVGLSNLFVAESSTGGAIAIADAFASAGSVASRLFPGQAVVGYQRGAGLDAAIAAGFDPIGPLSVWLKPDA